jgi:hypothetical protein
MTAMLFSWTKNLVITFLLFSAGLLVSCSDRQQKETERKSGQIYTTWENICYDRAASIWLIHNFVDPGAQFQFVPFGERIKTGIPFDVPGAELGRQKNLSCFETVIRKYDIRDSVLLELGEIVHDIDVNIWGVKRFELSDSLDKDFKELRSAINDENVLLDSLAIRFNSLYNYLYRRGLDEK